MGILEFLIFVPYLYRCIIANHSSLKKEAEMFNVKSKWKTHSAWRLHNKNTLSWSVSFKIDHRVTIYKFKWTYILSFSEGTLNFAVLQFCFYKGHLPKRFLIIVREWNLDNYFPLIFIECNLQGKLYVVFGRWTGCIWCKRMWFIPQVKVGFILIVTYYLYERKYIIILWCHRKNSIHG